MMRDRFIKKFQYIYEMDILNEFKNIPIPEPLVNDIKTKFDKNIEFTYSKQDLINLNENYKFLNKNNNYQLTVIITLEKDIKKNLEKYQAQFVGYTLNDIINELKEDYGIYIPTKYSTGLLILNYDKCVLNIDEITNVIKHELTHHFESFNKRNWQDLLPKDPNELEINNALSNLIVVLRFRFNLDYTDIYYLTSGKEFESYCTTLEHYKNQINFNNINYEFLFNDNFQQLTERIKRLYIFILLNKIFDKSGKRLKYIEEHLK